MHMPSQLIVMELLMIGSPLNAHLAPSLEVNAVVPQQELRVAVMAGLGE
ncbi:hypothetical protein [Bradyrhizobium centrosematis]